MQSSAILRISSILLMLFSMTMLPAALVSLLFKDGSHMAFVVSFIVLLALGFAAWLPVRNDKGELRTRDGFVITVTFWLLLGLAGSVVAASASSTPTSISCV